MESPMTALWTRRAVVTTLSGNRRESVVGWRQLHHQVRDPVPHLREGHGIDDLVADAVIVLSPEMRLAPEVIELDAAQRFGHLLGIEALGLLDAGDERVGRVGEVDAGGVPLAVFLGVTRLP